jgi:hypothetical protein
MKDKYSIHHAAWRGVYGRCYGVTLGCSPYCILIKIHKYPGMADLERWQLIEIGEGQ